MEPQPRDPDNDRGAKVRGWVGPGSIPVQARDIDDIRDGTYSGLRRPGRRGSVRQRVSSRSATVQAAAVVAVIALTIGTMGGIAYLLRDRSADIGPEALSVERCQPTAKGVRYSANISPSIVDSYMDVETVRRFSITVEVLDGDALLARSSFDVDVGEYMSSLDLGFDHLEYDLPVPVEHFIAIESTPESPRCSTSLVARR